MMEEREFSPTLYPNKIAEVKDGKLVIKDYDKETYEPIFLDVKQQEYFESNKYDGIRLLIFPKIGMVTRSLKQVQNKNLYIKLKPIVDWCTKYNIMLDGEMYDENLTFQEINSIVMTQGYDKEVPSNFKFYIFDALNIEKTEIREVEKKGKKINIFFVKADYNMPFKQRLTLMPVKTLFEDIAVIVEQNIVSPENYDILKDRFRFELDKGNEGLILKNPNSTYKCNRITVKESDGMKFKEYITEDMEIIAVNQATVVRKGAVKKVNELGRSVTSKKKGDRVLIERASTFTVHWNGMEFDPSISGSNEVKEDIWANKEKYIGEFVEVKFMMVGSKDGKPRQPSTLRMRWKEFDE